MANLKFYKGGQQPTAVGSIWFNNGLLSVVNESGNLEYFSGVRDAEWKDKLLSITKADGTKVELDFRDVASAEVLGQLRTDLYNLTETVGQNATTAATGIQQAKDAAKGADDKAVAAKNTIDAYVTSNDARVKDVEDDLAGYKETNDAAVEAVEDRATALESRATAIEGILNGDDENDGLLDRVAVVEGMLSGSEGGSVQNMIDSAIETLSDNVDTKLAGKVDNGTLATTVEELETKITAEETRATAKEDELADAIAAEKERIDTLVGAKNDEGNFVDAGKSVRTIASEEVAAIVAGADEAYDTLKEIADWIAAHPEDAAGYNERIIANKTAIEALQGQVGTGTVDKRIEDAVKVVADDLAQYKIDEKVVTDGLADRVKAIEDLKISDEFTGVKNRVTAVETAVNTTLPAAIATAKGEAVAAAAEDATSKANAAQAAAEATAAAALSAESVVLKKYADDAVAVEAAKVKKNADDIEALQAQVNTGLAWAYFPGEENA